MARKSYSKSKKRRESDSFLALPHALINAKNFSSLSGNAVKLLIQVGGLYNGRNNGDLSATFSELQLKGWKSKETLNNALKELMYKGFIFKTRQGRFPKTCSLYALTWKNLDDSEKYDPGIKQAFKIGAWKDEL
jgi:hypothetical protein